MSIVRCGDGSDLYIYQTVDTEIVCRNCFLMPAEEVYSTLFQEEMIEHRSFTCNSFDDMISHVREHIDQGHQVTDNTIPELERRRDKSHN